MINAQEGFILFFSQRFELIMALNLAAFVFYVLVIIFVKATDRSVRQFVRNSLENVLIATVYTVQILLIFLLIFLYWVHYHKPAEYLTMPADIIENTHWVKSSQTIYFIDGNDLLSTQVNGKNKKYVYEGKSPIREYHIAPDGKNMVIAATNELILFNIDSREPKVVDTLRTESLEEKFKGVINEIHWSPNADAFTYAISRWSAYSSVDSVYIYFVDTQEKKIIENPVRKISRLYWDKASENLYYIKYDMEDQAQVHYVKVVRIPLQTLRPEVVFETPYDSSEFPLYALEMRGIHLFEKGDMLAFGGFAQREQLVAEDGRKVGIDKDDNFYFINEKWFKQRMFKVRRKPKVVQDGLQRYQYQGGDLAITNIRWLPAGRYVMMEHHDLGILIYEPQKNKIGQLLAKRGRNFGWYFDINQYHVLEGIPEEAQEAGKNVRNRHLSFVPK